MGVVILTGESCSGKDTIRRALEKKGYKNIVSYTTRPIRCGEINGVDYNFVGEEVIKIKLILKIKFTYTKLL